MQKPIPKAVLIERLEWSACFLSLTSLAFSNFAPLQAALGFLTGAVLFASIRPTRAARALTADWLPWTFVALALVSTLWSQAPGFTVRYVLELALTVYAALVMAGGLRPLSFLSALMCALLVVDAVGLYVGRYELFIGGWAMIGAFGSKNSFSAAQAILFLTSFWVLLGGRQGFLIRVLALLGTFGGPFLLILGRSVDSVAPLLVATSVTFLAYTTVRFPTRTRLLSLFAGVTLLICILSIAIVFRGTIVDELLTATGKDTTLTGRTYLWEIAGHLMDQNPVLGTGYGAFWVHGNPYAEQIWGHFGLTDRTGFNFHNVWYQQGVELGFLGIAAVLLTMLVVLLRVTRWVFRFPTAESLFFLGYVIFVGMRSVLETELFSQFAYTYVAFVAAALYGRYAPRITGQRAPPQAALPAPSQNPLFDAANGFKVLSET